jgi:glycosyltransferase involved in cell wall biosynthesis
VRIALQQTQTGHHGGLPRFFQVLTRAFEAAGVEVCDPADCPDLLYAPAISFERVPITDVPLVCTFHDAHWKHFQTFGRDGSDALEAIGKEWTDRADLVCCSSEAMRRELSGFYPQHRSKIRVVHLPPLVDERAPTRKDIADLRHRGLPPAFAYMPAQAGVHKNHLRLLSGWSVAKHGLGISPPPLVLSGMGTDSYSATNGPAVALGLEPGVDVIGLGYVTDGQVRALLERCEMLVMPTLYDAGSFPIMEAMLVGRPVLSSNLPAVVEQVRRQHTWCTFFDRFDPRDIAAALVDVVAHPDRARDLAASSRFGIAREGWLATGAGYRRVFEEVVGGQGRCDRPHARGGITTVRITADRDIPAGHRWASSVEEALRRAPYPVRVLPVPGRVGYDEYESADAVFVFDEHEGVGTVAAADGSLLSVGFGPRCDIVLPVWEGLRGAPSLERQGARHRYALHGPFALWICGSEAPTDLSPRMAAEWCAHLQVDHLAACGVGTELLRPTAGVIGVGLVDDPELAALAAEADVILLHEHDGQLGATAREAAVSGTPVMRVSRDSPPRPFRPVAAPSSTTDPNGLEALFRRTHHS